jgi:membrane-associated phospholipid phosphatase
VRPPFCAWPGWPLLRSFARLYATVSLLFVVVYGGADLLTAQRTRLRIDFAWEAGIPLWPEFSWVYMSIYLPLLFAPFVLRSERELRALARAAALVIGLAGLGFLLFPAELGYPPPPALGGSLSARAFRVADALNLRYNLAPSLHVALSSLALGALATRARPFGRWLLLAWALLIGLSTLLTHQHHVVDVVSGYALAGLALAPISRSPDVPAPGQAASRKAVR